MTRIRYIIDIDGFPKENNIFFKEVAIYDLEYNIVNLYHILLPVEFLAQGKNKTINFCMKNIHGMEFRNYTTDISYYELIYNMKRMNRYEGFIWAYKGGTVEKKLLDELHFDSINLENLGCPKFEKILDSLNSNFLISNGLSNCPRHIHFIHKKRICHCSAVEVKIFAVWLKKKLSLDSAVMDI